MGRENISIQITFDEGKVISSFMGAIKNPCKSDFEIFRMYNSIIKNNMKLNFRLNGQFSKKEIENLSRLLAWYVVWHFDMKTSILNAIIEKSPDSKNRTSDLKKALGIGEEIIQIKDDDIPSFKRLAENLVNSWYFNHYKKKGISLESFNNTVIQGYINQHNISMLLKETPLEKTASSVLQILSDLYSETENDFYSLEELYTIEKEGYKLVDYGLDKFTSEYKNLENLLEFLKNAKMTGQVQNLASIYSFDDSIKKDDLKLLRSIMKHKKSILEEKALSVPLYKVLSVALRDIPPWLHSKMNDFSTMPGELVEMKELARLIVGSVYNKLYNKPITKEDRTKLEKYLGEYYEPLVAHGDEIDSNLSVLTADFKEIKKNNPDFMSAIKGISKKGTVRRNSFRTTNMLLPIDEIQEKWYDIIENKKLSSGIQQFITEHEEKIKPTVEEFMNSKAAGANLSLSQKSYIVDLLSNYAKKHLRDNLAIPKYEMPAEKSVEKSAKPTLVVKPMANPSKPSKSSPSASSIPKTSKQSKVPKAAANEQTHAKTDEEVDENSCRLTNLPPVTKHRKNARFNLIVGLVAGISIIIAGSVFSFFYFSGSSRVILF